MDRDTRRESFERLGSQSFDLLVIGGGINGAGIARDAAMRGLCVALVEKGDFGSGTSSKSSKLIHGGVRYLQQRDFRLVRVACRERDLLRRRVAPHLVRPLPFVFPVYSGDPVGVFTLGVGMWLYDALAIFRNIQAHKMHTARGTLTIEPGLRPDRLRGAAVYYDCFTDDARLTLETVLAARDEGAVLINYAEVLELNKTGGRISGAVVADRLGELAIEIKARCVVNATGPWADAVRRLDDSAAQPCLRLTKGVHIVVPHERVGNMHAVVMHSPRDRRVLFVIPWGQHAIIGTTDTDFSDPPDTVSSDPDDVDYLLDAANWYFPQARLTQSDVISTYAGLRPLVAPDDAKDPSAVSREEAIFESASGLITLGGGKLTTYRLVAAEIVDRVLIHLGRRGHGRHNRTASKPLPGAAMELPHPDRLAVNNGHGLSRAQLRHLAARYGSRTAEVVDLVRNDHRLSEPLLAELPDIWAEAAYAVAHEMAVQPDDILMRRTHVALKAPAGASAIRCKLMDFLQKLPTVGLHDRRD